MVLISYQEPIQQVKLSAEVDYFNPEAGLKMSYPYKNVYFSDKLRFSGIEKHPTIAIHKITTTNKQPKTNRSNPIESQKKKQY